MTHSQPERAPRASDPSATLILDNLPLVGYLVSDLCSRATHLSRDDLASVGAIALITAARAYDPARGVPFGAYARQRIVGALADHLRSNDWAGRGARQRMTALTEAEESLASQLHRAPTRVELAAVLGLSVDEVREVQANAARRVTDLDDEVIDQVRATGDGPEELAIAAEERSHLRSAIAALPERMRHVIVTLFFDDRTVGEIAAELGVTHSAVSQQRSQALALLRSAIASVREDVRSASTPISAESTSTSDARRAAYLARFAEARAAAAFSAVTARLRPAL